MAHRVTVRGGTRAWTDTTPRKPRGAIRWRLQLRISERRLVLALGDVALSAVSVFLALRVWAIFAERAFSPAFVIRHTYWFAVLPPMWYVLAAANDYYNLRVTARLRSSIKRLALITLQMFVAYIAIFFVSPRGALPRLFIIYYAVISLALIGLWRAGRIFLVGWTGLRRRALVVGADRAAQLIWRTIERETVGDYELMGCVVSAEDESEAFPEARVVGKAAELPTLVRDLGITELIVTYMNAIPADVFQGVTNAYTRGVAVMPMPILYEQITGRVPIEHVGEHLWALVLPFEGESLAFNLYQLVKRVLDLVLALVGLLCFALMLPVLALLIKLDSHGSVFYRQARLGRGGRIIKIVKLRSMRPDAEADSGPQWAEDNDPRVTRVGRVLRKTRLDEVPQLVNVLLGQMSIVGPRPERAVFVDMLEHEIPFYRTRLAVKPGLTGWAQVRYPYGNSVEDQLRKLQYDLYYIRHQGLLLDILIMLKTCGTMLLFRGT